ncbi:MAG TPA: hypothetical protein VGP07_12435 [Polyangia bacterium]|jgi:hypothetical protein
MTTSQGQGLRGWIVKGCLSSLTLFGCATSATAERPAPADIRGNAAVSGPEAQPLVAGPIRLLHVNSDGRAEPRFSRVWRRDGAADCKSGTPLAWDGQSEVAIQEDELVCVAADGPARFSWHGRSIVREAPAAIQQASLR